MYINSAYLNHSRLDFKDKSKPLIVGSCGTYHLYTRAKLPTWRPRGRLDFQLLYVAAGKAYFYFGKSETPTIVNAGNMVLYRPKEPQKYIYYSGDQTEVYWVHFTGSNVTNILRSYGIDSRIIYTGTSLTFSKLYKEMIRELQRCQTNYQEMLCLYLRQLFICIHREVTREKKLKNEYLDREMELATQYFYENYNTAISIQNYASSRGMSVSWFIRSFKEYTGNTPMQFIVSIRLNNAQTLLETTNYNIKEISSIIGYENPLYFSRLFKKMKGAAPSDYRKQLQKNKI